MVGIVPSQDFCPWAGIATKLSSGPGALLDRPRISAPGQALRLEERKRVQHLHAVPGFLPLGRHCDPRSLRHCDTLTCVLGPRISAPGQALRLFRRRRVGATFGLDSPRISAPGQALRPADNISWATPPECPRISAPGQALRCPHVSFFVDGAGLVPGFLPLGRHCDARMFRFSSTVPALSQDFCPWAGIAMALIDRLVSSAGYAGLFEHPYRSVLHLQWGCRKYLISLTRPRA